MPNRRINGPQKSEQWSFSDSVVKKSKLELEKENSKKRLYSDTGFEQPSTSQDDFKRKRTNQSLEPTAGSFMSDVVLKKSRIEMEKEAALKAKLQEKENQLKKKFNQKDLVMKFEVIEPRSSRSPSLVVRSKSSIAPGRASN